MIFISDEDKRNLVSFDAKQRAIRDYIRIVIRREAAGVYFCGPPGTSKTHTAISILEEEEASYRVISSHTTGVGLFRIIRQNPHATIVLDDVTAIFGNPIGKQILLSALGETNNGERSVGYHTAKDSDQCIFKGGIIAISNLMLKSDPISKALTSRVMSLEYAPSHGEIKAYLKQIAVTTGLRGLTIEESKEVVSFLISTSEDVGRSLDLRHGTKCAGIYRCCRKSGMESKWQDLVVTCLKQEAWVEGEKVELNRDERLAAEQSLVLQILEAGAAKGWTKLQMIQPWIKATGKSERAYYRRLNELRAAGRVPPENPLPDDDGFGFRFTDDEEDSTDEDDESEDG